MNRRSFLRNSACAATLSALAPLSLSTFAEEYKKYEKRIPIGLELYSLRDVINHDTFPKYLKLVAEMGYECVEFAGYHGYSAKELHKLLADVGLKATSTHIGFGAIQGDELKKSADFAAEVGFNFLIVPGGLEGRIRESFDSNKKCAEEMSACAEKAAEFGMFVGFHGHSGDYMNIKDTDVSAWVTFFNNCDPRVIAQVDVGWCDHAHRHGQKLTPAETLAALPGRGRVLHIKSDNTDVHGCCVADKDDQVNWKDVFEVAHEKAGTEYFIVEQESWKVSSVDSAKECLENLKKLGW
ncbi:MAG: sugar phosphate isomerase/epimerase [Planctomycetia bacterium]|nr:sugar phosphate isomerase/epimerase [Planctomycetia bacterium]